MSPSIDPAILRALNLNASSSKISTHGGSGFASTFRITTPTTSIFVKQSQSSGAKVMFQGEHASLNAMHGAVPSLCPQSFAWGSLENNGGYFLATEFLDLSASSSRTKAGARAGTGSGMSLAEKLAKLHTTPAPIPEGFDSPQFGFPVTTCCGDTPQDNTFTSSWAEFFSQRRLLAILERGEKTNGGDPELRTLVERTVNEVVPRLLGDGHLGGKEGIKPAIVHGDLWSGNKSKGFFVGRGGDTSPDEPGPVEDVVFDPSSCYAHHEFDFGIMNMFGGFSGPFWKEYHAIVPKTEPAAEYEDRVALYESYHHLNHFAIFGGGYASGAKRMLKGLLKNYGD
ncbi:serine/threonine protein kinase [Cladophialophora yegresii CBS 114405]|uniref:protein-ribulosamine 3-kinase n=1 Tax=Cladophialophora yegresii CBS 114405 TaxID=1182544 RepID=W9VZF2_9EURO|nr:serine/threonine protein kinase [Cladophialophora yegresii CBS 114405]EXJ61048.1 serine/threonine protein kinase [Cladophialophora yegresii CBS 114405]